jgi:hypothetical protein
LVSLQDQERRREGEFLFLIAMWLIIPFHVVNETRMERIRRGHFSILALDRLNEANGVTEFPFHNRHSGAAASIQPLPGLQLLAKLSLSWAAVFCLHEFLN